MGLLNYIEICVVSKCLFSHQLLCHKVFVSRRLAYRCGIATILVVLELDEAAGVMIISHLLDFSDLSNFLNFAIAGCKISCLIDCNALAISTSESVQAYHKILV